jgi:hypothetical protein
LATDATGAPTPLGIPKFNTSADAPSGLGSNAQMDSIDALIAARVSKPTGIASGEVPVWNGTAFVRSSTTKINASNIADGIAASQIAGYPGSVSTKYLSADGTFSIPGVPGGVVQIYDRVVNIPITRTGTTTTSSAVVTGLSQTSDLIVGMHVSGTGLVAGSRIASIDSSSQITLGTTVTTGGTPSLTFEVDYQNSLTEESIYSKQINANDLSTNKMLRWTSDGDFLYNVASTSLQIKVKFGATTVIDFTLPGSTAVSATRLPYHWVLDLQNYGTANQLITLAISQVGVGTAGAALASAAWTPTTGIIVGGGGRDEALVQNTAALDTTANQTLNITAKWSAGAANSSMRQRYALLELI